jgi:murein DD-endopeptidase MepM/ murein hydrolase activator NlpD
VTLAGWKNGYGNTVIIDHGHGISTLYGHQSKLVVRTGQHVDQGQQIGNVGATGHVTAAHLHYEVLLGGVPRNPMPWL